MTPDDPGWGETVSQDLSAQDITTERQDYLKMVFHLQYTETPVRTTILARALGVEPASVTGVIKRLAELELLDYRPYKGVSLTEQGEKIALEIVRNHRLIELFLVKSLGYSWDEVHEEAERLEHVVSPRFIERIDHKLGHPEIDPHGEPIPTEDGTIKPRGGVPLTEVGAGTTGTVCRVDDEDPELLRYLASLDIRPGRRIEIVKIEPYGGPLSVVIDEGSVQLVGIEAAKHVFIDVDVD
jgi:DtxR family Mn-dependent transcriptional regulator